MIFFDGLVGKLTLKNKLGHMISRNLARAREAAVHWQAPYEKGSDQNSLAMEFTIQHVLYY